MTKRIFVVLALAIGVVLGIWIDRAEVAPAAPAAPVATVAPSAAPTTPEVEIGTALRGRIGTTVYRARTTSPGMPDVVVITCKRGWSEDGAANLHPKSYVAEKKLVLECTGF